MKKRLLALVLCIGMALGNASAVYANEETVIPAEAEESLSLEDIDENSQVDSLINDNGGDGSTVVEMNNAVEEDVENGLEREQEPVQEVPQEEQEDQVFEEENLEVIDDALNESETQDNSTVDDSETVETTYSVAIMKAEGGDILFSDSVDFFERETIDDINIVDLCRFTPGTEVTLETIPYEEYELKLFSVVSVKDNDIEYETSRKETGYSFVMPEDNVIVSGVFEKKDTNAASKTIDMKDAKEALITGGNEEELNRDINENVNSGECGDNLTWEIDEQGRLIIAGTGEMYDWEEYSSIEDNPELQNNETLPPWFLFREDVTEIIFEDGVTSIGNNAFCNFNIQEVVFPESFSTIGVNAFSNCKAIKTVVIPQTVSLIKERAFAECSGIEDITITGNTSLESNVFYNVIPKNLFYSGSEDQLAYFIEQAQIDESKTIIHFNEVPLEGIILSNKLAFIGIHDTFAVDTITDPENGCIHNWEWDSSDASIASVDNNGVITGNKEGKATITVKSGNISASLEIHVVKNYIDSGKCGTDAYWVITGSYSDYTLYIYGEGELEAYSSGTYNNTHVYKTPWYEYFEKIQHIVIEDGITTISDGMFYNYINLKDIVFPNTLLSIKADAFSGCSSLQNLELPYGLEEIGVRAFSNCASLTVALRIPDSVNDIGQYAFYLTPITGVTIPRNLSVIQYRTFMNTNISGEIFIPDTVEMITGEAFKSSNNNPRYFYFEGDAPSMSQVSISGADAYLGAYTYNNHPVVSVFYDKTKSGWNEPVWYRYNSYGINKDEFPDESQPFSTRCGPNLEWNISGDTLFITGTGPMFDLGEYPWQNVSATIKKVVVSDGVTLIGRNAFSSLCYGDTPYHKIKFDLEKVEIPQSVTKISEYAFSNAFNREANIDIELPNNITEIERKAFSGINKLQSLKLPARLETIGDYAFAQGDAANTYLFNLHIPPSVSSIGVYAFGAKTKYIYFWGDAPSANENFANAGENHVAKIYYNSHSIGWTTPTWNNYPTESFEPSDHTPWSIEIESIDLNETEKHLMVGDSFTVLAEISPKYVDFPKLTWNSSNSNVVAVDQEGNMKALAQGTAIISARSEASPYHSQVKASCKVYVYNRVESLHFDESELSLNTGSSHRMVVDIKPDDAKNVKLIWDSSAPEVVSVTSSGVLSALKAGNAIITVKTFDDSFVDTCTVTVQDVPVSGIELSTHSLSIEKNQQKQLNVSFIPNNATNKGITWSSNDSNIAIVDQNGLVTGIENGSTQIIATTVDGGIIDTCDITVFTPLEKISLDQTSLLLLIGETTCLHPIIDPADAVVTQIVWASSDDEIVNVDQSGNIYANKEGKAEITITESTSLKSASCLIDVKKHNQATGLIIDNINDTITYGEKILLTASGGDGEGLVEFFSSNEEVASIDENNYLRIVGIGDFYITATKEGDDYFNSQSYQTPLIRAVSKDINSTDIVIEEIPDQVYSGFEINPAINITVNGVPLISNTDYECAFTNNTDVGKATVLIKGINNFTGQIEMNFDIIPGLDISASSITIPVGAQYPLIVQSIPEFVLDKTLHWTAEDSAIASVDANGVVKGKKEGITTVTVTLTDNRFTATCLVNVIRPEIILDNNSLRIGAGKQIQLNKTVRPEGAEFIESWSSSNENVATVDPNGLVTMKTAGDAIITYSITYDGEPGIETASCTVEVFENWDINENSLYQIEINNSIYLDTSNCWNGETVVLTWSSSDSSIATVDDDGIVTAVSNGTVTLKGTSEDGNHEITRRITVFTPVEGISISSDSMEVNNGNSFRIDAEVSPNSASNKNVTWTSSNPNVVSCDGYYSAPVNGKFTAVSGGVAYITVTTEDGGFTDTIKVIVNKTESGTTGNNNQWTVTDNNDGSQSLYIDGKGTLPDYPSNGAPWAGSSDSIEEIYIADGIQSIGAHAFENSPNLRKVVIPESVAEIGENCFANDTALEIICYGGSKEQWDQMTDGKDLGLNPNVKIYYGITDYIPVTGIEISANDVTLEINREMQLSAAIVPEDASVNDYKWSSSNETVVTVDANGVIRGLAEGNAEVYAIPLDGGEAVKGVCNVHVTRIPITNTMIQDIPDQEYTGNSVCPKVTIYDGEYLLREGADYELGYDNNWYIGTGVVYIYGIGNYSDSTNKDFKINAASMTNCVISAIPDQTYTGHELYPEVTVKHGDITLNSGYDYYIEYSNNLNVGTATVTVTGNNGVYVGSQSKTFKINARDIKNAQEYNVSDSYYYTGKDITPDPYLQYYDDDHGNSYTLNKGTDYTVGYKNNKNVGTATVTITGKGNFKGTMNKTFKIVPVSVGSIWLNSSYEYLNTGDTFKLIATIYPENATNKGVTWSSSATGVVTVDANGKVTAKGPGTATITAKTKDGNQTATCQFNVHQPVTGVKMSKPTATMDIGSELKLSASVVPSNADNKGLDWRSSDSSIAYVDGLGVVRAYNTGTVTITARSYDGNKEAKCTVTVKVPDLSVKYRTHVQRVGWQQFVKDGEMSGTTGRSLRLEGINIELGDTPFNKYITYRTHVQKYGWQDWKVNGEMAGTSGEGKRLEAIQIDLGYPLSRYYDVYYQTHVQHFGWTGWASNGEMCGSAGYAYRLEGIKIKIVKKGEKVPGSTENVFHLKPGSSELPVSKTSGALVGYNTHVQTYGWQNYVYDGAMSGTSGQAKRLEGIQIKLIDTPYSGNIVYRTHVQTYGWQTWRQNGQMSGTSGEAKRLEGIQIYLTGEMAKHYDVYYRVHAQTYGWLDYAKNGVMAGTSGLAKRLEGINIVLVPKGGKAPGDTARPYVVGGNGRLPDNPYYG